MRWAWIVLALSACVTTPTPEAGWDFAKPPPTGAARRVSCSSGLVGRPMLLASYYAYTLSGGDVFARCVIEAPEYEFSADLHAAGSKWASAGYCSVQYRSGDASGYIVFNSGEDGMPTATRHTVVGGQEMTTAPTPLNNCKRY